MFKGLVSIVHKSYILVKALFAFKMLFIVSVSFLCYNTNKLKTREGNNLFGKKIIISSKKQVIIILLIFVIPLIGFFLAYNIITVNTINYRIAQSNKSTI